MANVRLPILASEPVDPLDRPEQLEQTAFPAEVDGGGAGQLMQVGDLARETGRTVRAIHLYEELGLLAPAARSKGRYRLYAQDSLVRIRWIGQLQEMGFSLGDIQTVVREWESIESAPGATKRMREVYARKLEETRQQIRRLQMLEHEIEASIGYLDTCQAVCDPERLVTACRCCDLHEKYAHEKHAKEIHVPDLVRGFRAHSPHAPATIDLPRTTKASKAPKASRTTWP
jgi:MerR family transcriptional regulator, copper efflux regulator